MIDPELGENIVDLGFIYDIAISRRRRPDHDDGHHARTPCGRLPEGRRGEQRRAQLPASVRSTW